MEFWCDDVFAVSVVLIIAVEVLVVEFTWVECFGFDDSGGDGFLEFFLCEGF